jgi:hypothetical protein
VGHQDNVGPSRGDRAVESLYPVSENGSHPVILKDAPKGRFRGLPMRLPVIRAGVVKAGEEKDARGHFLVVRRWRAAGV